MAGTILAVADGVKARRGYRSPLRAEQAGQTRRRVLLAARDLFLARGYAGTTVTAVAQTAGVSPDTIYTALAGKRGLLEGVWAIAVSDPRTRTNAHSSGAAATSPRCPTPTIDCAVSIALSCQTLARTSPVHAVIRGAADGHPFAAELRTRMLHARLDIQSGNLHALVHSALRPGITSAEAAERYSALLSPELFHLLTVEQRWSPRRYETWVADLLDHDLLG